MSKRVLQVGGTAAAAGIGYYLYQAGGSPKVAEKQFERDIAKLTDNRSGEAQKKGEELATKAGNKIDNAYASAKDTTRSIDKNIQQSIRDAEAKFQRAEDQVATKASDIRKDTNAKIAEFDKTVEKKAAEAKSGISSWWTSTK